MSTTKKFELIFKYAAGNQKTISVTEPKDGITEEEAVEALNTIIDQKVFYDAEKGFLTTAYKAQYKITETELVAQLSA